MYGGRLGLLFGSQIELQPFFLRGNKFVVDSARGPSVFGPGSAARSTRIDHLGANLQVNLGHSDIVPFVRAGGGLLKFKPDSGEDTRRLTYALGAGLRLNMGGITGEVFAEQFQFRTVPGRLFGADTLPLPVGEKVPLLRNMSYGASLNIPLSTVDPTTESSGLRGARAPIEVFVGRLNFANEMGLADQDLIGVRTGLDFGPQVGVRGYFMRGVNGDHDKLDPLASYGGEAQFTLSDGGGIKPYVVLGAGRIQYLKEYRDTAGNVRDDETALIVGGGATFSLSERLHANVAIRDFITSRGDELTASKEPDDLLHSRMLSAGLTFSIGGNTSDARERRRVADREAAMQEREARDMRVMRDTQDVRTPRDMRNMRNMRNMQDSQNVRSAPQKRMDMSHMMNADTIRMMAPDGSGRMLVIPVPTVGEIIIRYGPPGSSNMMRERETVIIDTMRVMRRTDSVRTDTVRIENTSADTQRLNALERQLAETRDELSRVRRGQAPAAVVVSDTRGQRVDTNDGQPGFVSRLLTTRPSNITPFLGVSTGDGTQFVVSGRIDLGPWSPGSRLDLVPELSLAVGDGRTTIMGMANARYAINAGGSVRPYVMVGGGLSNDKLFVLGTSVGLSANLRAAAQKPLYGFAEIQGINGFYTTRFLIGLSTRR